MPLPSRPNPSKLNVRRPQVGGAAEGAESTEGLPVTPVAPPAAVVRPASEMPAVLQENSALSGDYATNWMEDEAIIPFDTEHLESLNHEGELDEVSDKFDILAEDTGGETGYASFGELTSQDIIDTPYARYAHLEDKVETTVSTIREILQSRADEIRQARLERGKKYRDLATEVDRLALRQMSGTAENSVTVEVKDQKVFLAMVVNELLGFGPVEPLWQDPTISEIMINGPHEVRIEQGGHTKIAQGVRFRSSDHLLSVARQMLILMGRKIDVKTPLQDGTLPDGSRINVVHQDLAPHGPLITIRRFPDTIYSMRQMVSLNSMTPEMAVEIGNLIYAGCSTVIAGGTGTGKALSTATPIPTTSGMKMLGDLQVGDLVFDETGATCSVTGYYPQEPNRECFEVLFSDGSSVIADADHNWAFARRDGFEVLTTRQALAVLRRSSEAVAKRNLTIPVVSAAIEWSDVEESEMDFYQVGYDIGTDNDVRIPSAVTYGAPAARRSFLEGFLDAGRSVRRAQVHSTGLMDVKVSNLKTLEDLNRIVNSLGSTQAFIESYENMESSLYFYLPEGVWEGSDRREDDKYQVEKNTRHIVDICPVDSVPVACISVDSPNHLYLFGDSFIPTHNTSMLNALSGCIPDDARVLTIEDTPELRLNPRKHVVPLVSRPGNEKEGGIPIRLLVRNALRMRPDRIVVGEVRDRSAYDMLQAMNTGHEGSLTTVHANDAHGTVERICLLVAEAGEVTADRAISLVAGGVDLFIIINRYEDGSRRIAAVHEVPSKLEVINGQNALITRPLFEFVHDETDKTGKVIGHYEAREPISPELRERHRLDKKTRLNLEEIYKLSDISLEMLGS